MMKQFHIHFLLFLAISFFSLPVSGQRDIFNSIFEQEEPVFFATILPSETPGEVKLEYYFTHSKLSALEVSFWIKDLGTSFRSSGERILVKGLEEAGNREQKTISIQGLSDQHFYTIGIDYRNPKSLSRKFNPTALEEGYLYHKPSSKERVAEQKTTNQSRRKVERQPDSIPCQTPDIKVFVESGGYCGANNRPAVLIQCTNCQSQNWDFSVEVRTQREDWRSLRTDGRRQSAIGVSTRTEPFCTLAPGDYFVRVKAWGQGCETPVINSIGSTITITDPRLVNAATPSADKTTVDRGWSRKSAEVNTNLPDTCHVAGRASLDGKQIKGVLRLESYSPCQMHNPYAKVVYVHPAHRDITLDMVPLRAGESTPFLLRLDDRDLNRGIHTLRVVTYIKPETSSEPIPVGSFWLKAENGVSTDQPLATNTPPPPPPPAGYYSTDPKPNVSSNYERGWQMESPAEEIKKETDKTDPYESSLTEDIDAINISATDPNCTQIQDLQLVYSADQPNQPLYISWLSPRCCQEGGCDYTVWAGRSPDKMRLLVSGNKSGAMIREIMQGIQYNDEYFEVAVKTSNGSRKAAYLLGRGPIYGVEEVLAYHDQFNPQKQDPLILTKGEETITADKDGTVVFEVDPIPVITYEKPNIPATNFVACKYRRQTSVIAEQPILDGDQITVKYDYSGKGYKYTLYYLPPDAGEWVIAPGTKELQEKASFDFRVNKYSSGQYLVLTYSPDKNWGCLSAPLEEALEINVEK